MRLTESTYTLDPEDAFAMVLMFGADIDGFKVNEKFGSVLLK